MKKHILILVGTVSLILGLVGVVVPLLPTTPFLLLSAASYARSSEKLHTWLLNHPWFGKYIRNFQEHKAIPLGTKIFAVSLLWITILASVIFWVDILLLRILLIAIAIAVSAHILHYKTLHT